MDYKNKAELRVWVEKIEKYPARVKQMGRAVANKRVSAKCIRIPKWQLPEFIYGVVFKITHIRNLLNEVRMRRPNNVIRMQYNFPK